MPSKRLVICLLLVLGAVAFKIDTAKAQQLVQDEASQTTAEAADTQNTASESDDAEGAASLLIGIPNFWNVAAPPPAPQQVVRQVRFVTADDFPPFNFLDANDTLIGFNVDLARAACEELGAQCTMAIRPFDALTSEVTAGNVDAAIAGLSPSATSSLVFSDTYFTLPARFVAKQAAKLEGYPEALVNQTIGVVANSAHQRFLEAYFPDSNRKSYDNATLMRMALLNDEVPIIFDDAVTASYWLNSQTAAGCCQFASGAYLNPSYFGDGLKLAVAPGNDGLLEALNYALYRVFASGRYAEIYLRYFPISPF